MHSLVGMKLHVPIVPHLYVLWHAAHHKDDDAMLLGRVTHLAVSANMYRLDMTWSAQMLRVMTKLERLSTQVSNFLTLAELWDDSTEARQVLS